MNISIQSDTDKYTLTETAHIEAIALYLCNHWGLSKENCELNINFTDDAGIEPVNVQFLNHEGPTDVISFDYIEDYDEEFSAPDDPFVLGELLISLETAESQAKSYKSSFNDEALLYLAHGILHLCGFDDHEEEDIKAMRAAEAESMMIIKDHFDQARILA
ncbi:rRNA maturation RNase YbeY [Lentisphaera profundi]|uniref:Endoribonuclease YbeY n=1 Tax=Lentisphaera profundi TaxID=1658616 RepID=A0ABY7VTD2_9BACT|nr:rRNA maturation RNase YbeY [Lentisphaera profundi]WDE96086.1 rRNA maturation RNase YbeY [Lentisphaera profundi]